MNAYKTERERMMTLIQIVAGALVSLFFVAPLLWMVSTALKEGNQAFSAVPTLFFRPTLDNLRHVAMRRRHLGPGEFGRRRDLVGRSQIGPDDAAQFDGRIGDDVDVLLELVLRRLVELVEAMAFDVELPAVIDAAQTAFLVAAKKQRHPAVRAEFIQ